MVGWFVRIKHKIGAGNGRWMLGGKWGIFLVIADCDSLRSMNYWQYISN